MNAQAYELLPGGKSVPITTDLMNLLVGNKVAYIYHEGEGFVIIKRWYK